MNCTATLPNEEAQALGRDEHDEKWETFCMLREAQRVQAILLWVERARFVLDEIQNAVKFDSELLTALNKHALPFGLAWGKEESDAAEGLLMMQGDWIRSAILTTGMA